MAESLLRTKHRVETAHAMARAILPTELTAEAIAAVADDFIDEIGYSTRDNQRILGVFLDLLDRALFVRTLGARAMSFRLLPPEEAERALVALARHPLPPLRAAFGAIRRGLCFVAYARSSGDAANPLWSGIGYPGPRSDLPVSVQPGDLPMHDARSAPREVDVVVVGSGAGGGVGAGVFAAAGERVLVLEEGDYLSHARIDQREATALRSLYLERGTSGTSDLGIGILAGRGVGGGTVINWDASLRIEPAVAEDWDRSSGLAGLSASLAPHYDAVSARLGLCACPDNAANAALRRGCARLGWETEVIPRNAVGCGHQCGYCTMGCAYGHKRDVTRTYLRDAVERGAMIIPGAEVTSVAVSTGRYARVIGVEWTARDGTQHFVRARKVVVAAGTLRTPKLLARSGVRAGALGKHLRLHPAVAANGVFDEPIEPWMGAPMTTLCRKFSRLDGPHGFLLEVAPLHPGLASSIIPWSDASSHAQSMRQLRHVACAIAITRDRDSGSVGFEDAPKIDYRISAFDGRHVLEGIVAAARAMLAAGAREVFTTHAPALRLPGGASEREIAAFRNEVLRRGHAAGRFACMSAHQMGTARMSARSADGVVDERGGVHGVRGLLVCDGSTFPAASGVNPMLTIMAMAHRIATLHARSS